MNKETKDQAKALELANSNEWPFLVPHPNTWHPTLKALISCFGFLVCIVIALGIIYLLYDIINL